MPATDSVNVTAEQIFALGVTNLREGDGWKKLAAMPVCTNCHARLDYGMQFFSGFPSSFIGRLYDPHRQASGSGPLYGSDIHDLLGEAPLTPQGYAQTVIKQPAFARCMVSDVSDHVFHGRASPEDERALAKAFEAGHRLRDVMREALLRYARSSKLGVAPDRPTTDKPLRASLDEHCGNCHTTGSRDFLRQTTWTPELLTKITAAVAFGVMPPNEPLELGVRNALLSQLVAEAYPDTQARSEALAYFTGGLGEAPVRDADAIDSLITARSGAPAPAHGFRWIGFDGAAYRPAVAATVRRTRRSTTAALPPGVDLQRCVDDAISSDGIVGVPLPK